MDTFRSRSIRYNTVRGLKEEVEGSPQFKEQQYESAALRELRKWNGGLHKRSRRRRRSDRGSQQSGDSQIPEPEENGWDIVTRRTTPANATRTAIRPTEHSMAATKKYANLPDLDAAPEIYETPDLTDDASTVQTSTLRTDSPAPSEDTNDNFDRSRFNRDEARRRFEPAAVNAKDVNFSFAVGGNQKSYTTRHNRRRRARQTRDGGVEFGDLSSESDDGAEETLGQKLARLKREAEEIRLEIERRDKEDGEFKDSLEHQHGSNTNEENEAELQRGMEELGRVLNRLQASTRPKQQTLEQEFSQRLNAKSPAQKQPSQRQDDDVMMNGLSPSTIGAITSFSDRLTALESALGLSNLTPSPNNAAILPTLDTLTSQVSILHSTISPRATPSGTSKSASSNLTPQMPHLDILQTRLHTLHQSASSLLNTRKQAQTALTELENTRLRHKMASEHLQRYQVSANRRAGRPLTSSNYDPDNLDELDDSRPTSQSGAYNNSSTGRGRRNTLADESKEKIEISDEIMTPLFLEEQAEKIRALYGTLPAIQNLQPLLPLVLDRLRGLSVVHAGAAGARADMDEVEERLRDWEAELAKWKEAVEGVERGIEEAKEVMRENVEVVGGQVRDVEERLATLEGGRR